MAGGSFPNTSVLVAQNNGSIGTPTFLYDLARGIRVPLTTTSASAAVGNTTNNLINNVAIFADTANTWIKWGTGAQTATNGGTIGSIPLGTQSPLIIPWNTGDTIAGILTSGTGNLLIYPLL
jgi:hypothetical protein